MIGAFLLAAVTAAGPIGPYEDVRLSVWSGENVVSGSVSRVIESGEFPSRTLYVSRLGAFHAETDEDGVWTRGGLKMRVPGIYDLKYLAGRRFRLVADGAATNVTAVCSFADPRRRRELSDAERTNGCVCVSGEITGGPWKDAWVRDGKASDPYPMFGYDRKFLSVSSDRGADITIELDITGTGVWIPFRTFKTADRINISNLRAYRLRAVADRDCKATVQLEYR